MSEHFQQESQWAKKPIKVQIWNKQPDDNMKVQYNVHMGVFEYWRIRPLEKIFKKKLCDPICIFIALFHPFYFRAMCKVRKRVQGKGFAKKSDVIT